MAKSKNILVCPLDWGLGHATRLVPIIDGLINKGANVYLGADNKPLQYLQQRFPNCKFIKFPGYNPKYPKNGLMALSMLRAYPDMLAASKNAHALLQDLIKKHEIDVVISDNRYELYSDKAYCVFITHQLNIQTPGISGIAKPFIQAKVNSYIHRYDELWIPDFPGENNLSGKLGHPSKMPINNAHYIGPLSRLTLAKPIPVKNKPGLLALMSGPEPQRSLLEEIILKQSKESGLDTIILQGKPGDQKATVSGKVQIIPHLEDNALLGLLQSAEIVISRPGYSTLMDLAVLGKKAIFIPTPGQTEQEYLAKRFKQSGIYYSEKQAVFNLQTAIAKSDEYGGIKLNYESAILQDRIDKMLD